MESIKQYLTKAMGVSPLTIKNEVKGVTYIQCSTCNFDPNDDHDCTENLELIDAPYGVDVGAWTEVGNVKSTVLEPGMNLKVVKDIQSSDLKIKSLSPYCERSGSAYATDYDNYFINVDFENTHEIYFEDRLLKKGDVLVSDNIDILFENNEALQTVLQKEHISFPINAHFKYRTGTVFLQDKSLSKYLKVLPWNCTWGFGFLYQIGTDIFFQHTSGKVQRFIRKLRDPYYDYVSKLNHKAQVTGLDVTYVKVSSSGPPHRPSFTVRMNVDEESFWGTASSIKEAKQECAFAYLEAHSYIPEHVIFEEQIGDMEEANTGNNPADETHTSRDIHQDSNVKVQGQSLQGHTQSSETAIDTTRVTPGSTSTRRLKSVMSPSGEVTAIQMTDSDSLDLKRHKYLMGASPPDWSIVWSKADSVASGNGVKISSDFNNRTQLQMINFQHWNALGLWKLVAPIALFQSQRFWVSFHPEGVTSTTQNSLGFEWNPSEESEIYVLTPWTGTTRTRETTATFPDKLYITPLTDIVYSEGQDTSIEITAYFAPHQLNMYTPNPVGTPIIGGFYTQLIENANGTKKITVSGDTRVVLTKVDAEAPSVSPNYDFDLESDIDNVLNVGYLTYVDSNAAKLEYDDNNISLSPGTHTLTFQPETRYTVISTNPIVLEEQIGGLYTQTLENSGTSTVTVSGDTRVVLKGIIADAPVLTPNYDFDLDSNKDGTLSIGTLTYDGFNEKASIDFGDLGVSLSPGTHTLTYTTEASYTVISSEPITLTKTPVLEEQIGGLAYDNDNSEAVEDFGKISNHTSRLDSHWTSIGSQPIASLTDQLLFEPFSNLSAYFLDDLKRHLLYSKYPVLQFRATSVPSANLLLRITQLPLDTDGPIPLDLALQLPGVEMNIKAGDMKIQPYFNSHYTGLYSDFGALKMQVDVLGGSIGLEPVFITCLANPSSIEYFHLLGPSFPIRTSNTIFEEQMADPSELDPQIQSSSDMNSNDMENVGVTESERRWQYVDSFQIGESTGAVSILLDKLVLGQHFYRHLRRYNLFKGRPRIKIMFTNARILSGNIHITQTSSPVPDSSVEAYTLLNDIGYIAISPNDPATQLELKWRNRSPYIRTTDTSQEANLGYLNIIIPQLSVGTAPTVPTSLICTIHVDTSDMELKAAQDPQSVADWTPPSVITMPRPAARIV